MNGITDRENELFTRWRRNCPDLVPDGVVNEEVYLASNPRLLFVLKEVNRFDRDLRTFLAEGGREETWNNVTRWVEGIRRLPKDTPWADLVRIDEGRRQTALASIVALNLNKSAGGHTTDNAALRKVALRDRSPLNEQFRLYDPTIVICCGVSEIFHKTVDLSEKPNCRSTSHGISYHEISKGKFVVDYSHPETRCAKHILHYGLVDAIREIRATSS